MRTIIIGRGGFAAETAGYLRDESGRSPDGFLELHPEEGGWRSLFHERLDGPGREFEFERDMRFILAIGQVGPRKAILAYLDAIGAEVAGLTHPTAMVASSAGLGRGNILCPYTVVGPNTSIGKDNILNVFSYLAHDAGIGDNNVFSPNNMICGGAVIGSDNFFGVSASLLPGVRVGDGCQVQAGATVFKNLASRSVLYNPGREGPVGRVRE